MTDSPKPDQRLQLGYGSAWHLLRCLGWQRNRFTSRVANAVGATSIDWLDFPEYAGKQCYPTRARIRDGEWQRINFIDDPAAQHAYDQFWPGRGEQQNWDAVGKSVVNGDQEYLLVEAKAHPGEVSESGTSAKESGGRPKIRDAFRQTLKALGYSDEEAANRVEVWLAGYYQHANRIATLHFLNQQKIPARLVFLYFCGDRHPTEKRCPADAEGWRPLVDRIHDSLGLRGTSDLEQRIHHVFVPVDVAGMSAKATPG